MLRLFSLLAAMACLLPALLAAPRVLAQGGQAALPRAYKIAVGDMLVISASGIPQIGNREVLVAPDGRISVPIVGPMMVAGLTITQVEQRLVKALEKYYLRPNVSVGVNRLNQERFINVIGPGDRSGKVAMKDGWRVLDALAASGGTPTERVELFDINLLRGEKNFKLNMKQLIQDRNVTQNMLLEAGDTILIKAVDESKRMVTVFGQVNRPAQYVLPSDGSIATVIAQAGGFTPLSAPSKAYIERHGQIVKVDMRGLDKGEVKEVLQMGDKIFVPENRDRINIIGAVNKPGEQLYPDDKKLKLSEALAMAVIPVQGADLRRVSVTRTGSDNKQTTQTVNTEKMIKDGDFSVDMELLPGDIINVPASRNSAGAMQNAQNALWIISTFLGILTFIRR